MSVNGILQGQVHKINGQAFSRDLTLDDIGAASVESLNPPITKSGDIVTFESKIAENLINPLVVNIEPVQAGSGDPSPSNVRPITGWTGARVSRTGKNLLENTANTQTINGATFTVDKAAGTISISGASNAYAYVSLGSIRNLQDGASYTISDGNGYAQRQFAIFDNTIGNWAASSHIVGSFQNPTFTYQASHNYSVQVFAGATSNTSVTLYPMIRLASDTDDTFEPYRGNTYAISFPASAGTVYGGTLDVARGMLTVDRGAVDLQTVSMNRIPMDGGYALYEYENANIAADQSLAISSYLKSFQMVSGVTYWTDIPNNSVAHSGARIRFRYDAAENTAQFRAAMAGQTTVYKLATPLTYQLTPQEVTTLLGINNIWADCGTVEATYRAGDKPAILTTADIGAYGGVAPYNEIVAAIISQGANV